jgi:Phage protein Gp138 N-terminal domain
LTDTSFSPFSSNPANNDSLSGLLRLVLRKWTQYLDNQLPAEVVAYSRSTNRAQVQPLILAVTTNGIQIKRAQIASVPVRMWGGGGTVASANLVAGDLGWLHANDRDISLFKQSFGNAPPNTKRQHSFEDAVFEPDPIEGVTIASGHSNDFVIQAKDGSSCAAFNTTNNVIELDSTTKAFQIPRMTTAQRDAIPTPRGGQMVYVTDSTPEPHFSFYTDGIGWS